MTSQTETFIARWQGQEGGQERANYALFLSELCDVLGVNRPAPAAATTQENDYVFERVVKRQSEDGANGHGRIDLYKRNCFVLEAKQSRQTGGPKQLTQYLPGMEPPTRGTRPESPTRGVRDASRTWDVLMLNARRQAEGYARALPTDHGWPPFILVCDVGHVIETYADFSGQGPAKWPASNAASCCRFATQFRATLAWRSNDSSRADKALSPFAYFACFAVPFSLSGGQTRHRRARAIGQR